MRYRTRFFYRLCAPSKNTISMQRIEPGPGQESVWGYPRPPRLEPVGERVRVCLNGATVADSTGTYRVLETSHPPSYYIPPQDVDLRFLHKETGGSLCEWKGEATYFAVEVDGRRVERAAWAYESPTAAFAPIRGYLSFYASKMDECYVGEERVQAQEGDFYGGWITSKIVGPFKGGAGTWGW